METDATDKAFKKVRAEQVLNQSVVSVTMERLGKAPAAGWSGGLRCGSNGLVHFAAHVDAGPVEPTNTRR